MPDLPSFLSGVFQFSFTLIVFCCALIELPFNFMCRADYPVAFVEWAGPAFLFGVCRVNFYLLPQLPQWLSECLASGKFRTYPF